MSKRADFDALVELALEAEGYGQMRPVVEKELLHYDILFALDRSRLLDTLTFQGGTSLRLCHGSPRFSEDLDFVGGRDFDEARMAALGECLTDYIGDRYGLPVEAKSPRPSSGKGSGDDIRVAKWQLSIVTAPRRPDIPKQRIKLEVANLPAYTREPQSLRLNYDFLPEGYADLLVPTETLNEVLADKLISLVNNERYVRHRDIWDLRWLAQRGASVEPELLRRKIADYRVARWSERARETAAKLPEIVQGRAFIEEMRRFLPAQAQARTLDRAGFGAFLAREVGETLTTAANAIAPSAGEEQEFTL
jgi:predicted nucleotidyltransferase component of viral defense system